MKIKLCQLRPSLGAVDKNVEKIRKVLNNNHGAEILVFPELFLSGYPPTDALFYPDFQSNLNMGIDALKRITRSRSELLLLGSPMRYKTTWHNAVIGIEKGEIIFQTNKQCLPNYNVFNDSRYFVSGDKSRVLKWKGRQFGVLICEDVLAENYPGLYSRNPIDAYEGMELDALIHISASPYEVNKQVQRVHGLQACAEKLKTVVISVNQVGAYNDLLFDGQSLVVDSMQSYALPKFQPSCETIVLDVAKKRVQFANKKIKENTAVSEDDRLLAIQFGLREYMEKAGFESVVIGVSGGIDSALVAALAVETLGPSHVHVVSMPTRFNSKETQTDAKILADQLGCQFDELNIDAKQQALIDDVGVIAHQTKPITEQNIQARLRGLLLMAIANQKNALLLTTGNKSELAMGYATLYGDMSGGLNIIGDLFKTEVFELARQLNLDKIRIPWRIIDREPSAELAENQKDTDSLPAYPILDQILSQRIIKKQSVNELLKMNDKEDVMFVLHQLRKNEFKRFQSPPIIKLSSQSFGRSWQFSLVE